VKKLKYFNIEELGSIYYAIIFSKVDEKNELTQVGWTSNKLFNAKNL
jgi:hypothetical protein